MNKNIRNSKEKILIPSTKANIQTKILTRKHAKSDYESDGIKVNPFVTLLLRDNQKRPPGIGREDVFPGSKKTCPRMTEDVPYDNRRREFW
ncbi:MAG: hypothetical protein N2Z84_04070 [Atribacterota bacterium]|nr:hypothetical protein [Atribacterota bacterium]